MIINKNIILALLNLLELNRRKYLGKFIRMFSAPIRLLPDFLIIGAQRCGTTFLYSCLKQHPNIKLTNRRKEVHFFDNSFNRSLLWYKSHFPTIFYKYYYNYTLKQKLITGEASPYYLLHPLVSKRVKSIIPEVKIIILLRNPIDRAYSAYHLEVRQGYEDLSFENAIKKEKERLDGEFEKLIKNRSYHNFNLQHYSYLRRGLYYYQIKRWRKYFDQKQFKIINSKKLFNQPLPTLNSIFSFLNIPNYDINLKKGNKFKGTYPELNQYTRKRLNNFFKPHNKLLYNYLGRNFDWD